MTEITDEQITPKAKRIITKDWQVEFPQLATLKPMWMGRRLGPVFQFVVLERLTGGYDYRALTGVGFLGFDEEMFGIGGGYFAETPTRVPGSNMVLTIEPRKHHELYKAAVSDVKKNSHFPLEEPFGLKELLNGYESHFKKVRTFDRVVSMRAVVGILAWCGHTESALKQIEKLEKVIEPNTLPTPPGKEAFLAELREIAGNSELLHQRVEEKAKHMKLEKVPMCDLTNLDLPSYYL